jgi:hypothetical protein
LSGAFDIDTKGFTNLRTKMWHAAQKCPDWSTGAAQAGGLAFERGMKKRCAVGRTGATRNSIKTKVISVGNVESGPSALHASFLEYGTGLYTTYPGAAKHRIVPITKKVLSWKAYAGRGLKNFKVVAVKSTAGMEAQPFIRPTFAEDHGVALKAAQRTLTADFRKVFDGS